MIIENKCVNKQIISLKSYQKHCVDYHKDKLSHLSSTVQPHFEFCKGEKKISQNHIKRSIYLDEPECLISSFSNRRTSIFTYRNSLLINVFKPSENTAGIYYSQIKLLNELDSISSGL